MGWKLQQLNHIYIVQMNFALWLPENTILDIVVNGVEQNYRVFYRVCTVG